MDTHAACKHSRNSRFDGLHLGRGLVSSPVRRRVQPLHIKLRQRFVGCVQVLPTLLPT